MQQYRAALRGVPSAFILIGPADPSLGSAFVWGDCTYVVLFAIWLSVSYAESPLHELRSDREHCKYRKQHDEHRNT
jgi:hypothetical protein